MPLYHAALVREAAKKAGGIEPPVAVVNIGGVAQCHLGRAQTACWPSIPVPAMRRSTIGRSGTPARRSTNSARWRGKGKIDHAALDDMLAHAFFDRVPPKSLDRMDFGADRVAGLSAEDGAATLTAFTAASIARAREHFPDPATQWVVCGGGRHNPVLMEALRARVNAPVLAAEDLGWQGDFLEAEAFAYLAERARRGLPLSLPTTTGVPQPMPGGRLHRAR